MKPFTIACCQLRAGDLEEAELSLERILKLLDEAGEKKADLVLLPECSYPAYYLKSQQPYDRQGVRKYSEICDLLGQKAKKYGYWLVAGLAAPIVNGKLTNSGVVFDPEGNQCGQYDKTYLWHFDNNWFEEGQSFPVFKTDFVDFGILICADGRQPEIARTLKLNGAELIVDLTAWVSHGSNVADLYTPQCEYLMPVRAFENGVWVAAADKWGTENETIIYAGRSCIINPDGEKVKTAPTEGDMVLTHRFEGANREIPVPRKPDLYRTLTTTWEKSTAKILAEEPIIPDRENHRIGIAELEDNWFDFETLRSCFYNLRQQDCDIVLIAGLQAPEGWDSSLPELTTLVREEGGALSFAVRDKGCTSNETAVFLSAEGTTLHKATHGREGANGNANAPVISTPIGNVGILSGDEALVPEIARILTLEGAEFLLWSAFNKHPMNSKIVQARSDENRVYTAGKWPGGGIIASPTGSPILEAPNKTAMAAQVNKSLTRWKDMAPGTHPLRNLTSAKTEALLRNL